MDISFSTTLKHLTLITWDVAPEALQTLLPSALMPATVPSPDGPRGLFSMALMLEAGLAPKRLSWLSLYFAQLNERVYVTKRDGSGAGVFFWRSFVASPSFVFPRFGLGLPYFWKTMSLNANQEGLIFTVGKENIAELDLTKAPEKTNGPDPEEVKALTANPMIGYSLLRGKNLSSFQVEHEPLVPRLVTTRFVNSSSMIASGLLSPEQKPVASCYVETAPFMIHLPPKRVKE